MHSDAAVDLCVVIAANRNKDQMASTLTSVLERTGWLALDAVVVDNGDEGISGYVEERFMGVKTLRCEEGSLGRTYNCALEGVNARYVLFISPETEICRGDLASLVSVLERRPHIALAGVRQLNSDGSLSPSMRRFPSPRHMLAEVTGVDRIPGLGRVFGERERDLRKYGQETVCDWTSEFLLVRKAALENVGWFDERLQRLAGEADLCLRLKRSGWQVVHMPWLTVRRQPPQRWEHARREAEAAYARMQFARKHFPRISADYRWGLALRYALQIGAHWLVDRNTRSGQAARAALATVLSGRAPLDQPSR